MSEFSFFLAHGRNQEKQEVEKKRKMKKKRKKKREKKLMKCKRAKNSLVDACIRPTAFWLGAHLNHFTIYSSIGFVQGKCRTSKCIRMDDRLWILYLLVTRL